MEQSQLNWITGYIWGIADDVLRDLYVRGKYRDVILPMTVLRRFDAVLESSKKAVLDMKASLNKAGVVHQDQALRQAAGQAFYNTSPFTMRDLKARGLLEDTLVIWGGEFGRMPMSEQGTGRDHNPWGYSVVLAGAGVKGGMAYGATDAIGLRAQEKPVHIHDLHATLLHLLGIDHEHLTYLHNGRKDRLTDVAGKVVHEILS